MPSFPTHLLVGAALGQGAAAKARSDWRFWVVAVLGSALPDLDVIGFKFGIHYGDLWGHRGLTHSIFFGAVIGIVAGSVLGGSWVDRLGQSLLLLVITCSHGVLDAMTNGGLGVAFFSPFDRHRYFLPWRPIQVSPIAATGFVSARGLSILLNEMMVVWVPALVVGIALWAIRKRRADEQPQEAGEGRE